MATIGSFTADTDGYAGVIRTLTLNIKARIVANDKKTKPDSPDFRIYTGRTEIGAAWKARSRGESPRDYLRVKLDDPSFSTPIQAALFEDDGAATLVWKRPSDDADGQ